MLEIYDFVLRLINQATTEFRRLKEILSSGIVTVGMRLVPARDTLTLGKRAKDRNIRLAALFKYHKPKKVTLRNDTIAVNAMSRYQKTIRNTRYKNFKTMASMLALLTKTPPKASRGNHCYIHPWRGLCPAFS